MNAPRYRAFLVDDEPLALERLSTLLQRSARFDVVGTVTDPEAAIRTFSHTPPAIDVLFTDIQMPSITGLELCGKLQWAMPIVFTTAHRDYALDAFGLYTLDYLLKPIRLDDVLRVVAKLDQMRVPAKTQSEAADATEGMAAALTRLEATIRTAVPHATRLGVDRIPSKVGNRIQLLDIAEISHFFAEDKLTYAALSDRNCIVEFTLTELESRFGSDTFFRVHRGALVNLKFVEELRPLPGGPILLRIRGSSVDLTVSRERVRALKAALGIEAH